MGMERTFTGGLMEKNSFLLGFLLACIAAFPSYAAENIKKIGIKEFLDTGEMIWTTNKTFDPWDLGMRCKVDIKNNSLLDTVHFTRYNLEARTRWQGVTLEGKFSYWDEDRKPGDPYDVMDITQVNQNFRRYAGARVQSREILEHSSPDMSCGVFTVISNGFGARFRCPPRWETDTAAVEGSGIISTTWKSLHLNREVTPDLSVA
uniref:Uncharacterized protein n=1 Tax=Amblyomma americanum TaxID=6943 RepID=A0A0C9SE85_AMBAM